MNRHNHTTKNNTVYSLFTLTDIKQTILYYKWVYYSQRVLSNIDLSTAPNHGFPWMTHQSPPVYAITDTHPWIRVSREVPYNFTLFLPC